MEEGTAAGSRLLGDLTRQEAGWAFAPTGSTSPPLPCRSTPAPGLITGEEEGRKIVNERVPDSHLIGPGGLTSDWSRREKGGFRLGCVPAGKVVLSCVVWSPGARAVPARAYGATEWGSGSRASLSWHKAGESFQVGCGRR